MFELLLLYFDYGLGFDCSVIICSDHMCIKHLQYVCLVLGLSNNFFTNLSF